MKKVSSPRFLSDVIDRTVKEYLDTVGAAGFDRRQIERRILDTPEFRRIHDIQVQYLEDIDLETPIIDFVRERVHAVLREHIGPDGKKDLIEVLAGRTTGDRFTWHRVNGTTTPMLMAMLRALIEDEEKRPVQGNAARIARLESVIQQRQEAKT